MSIFRKDSNSTFCDQVPLNACGEADGRYKLSRDEFGNPIPRYAKDPTLGGVRSSKVDRFDCEIGALLCQMSTHFMAGRTVQASTGRVSDCAFTVCERSYTLNPKPFSQISEFFDSSVGFLMSEVALH